MSVCVCVRVCVCVPIMPDRLTAVAIARDGLMMSAGFSDSFIQVHSLNGVRALPTPIRTSTHMCTHTYIHTYIHTYMRTSLG
jgi:hypothetical protein